jgi:quercetin dioxygenase-like cupin family protein
MNSESQTRLTDKIMRGRAEAGVVSSPVGGEVTYWARGMETGGVLTFFEAVAGQGEGPPLHAHVNTDEFVYVLEGILRFRLDEEVREAPAGSFLFIPRTTQHTWQVAGDGPARFLFGFAPADPGMESFFERASEVALETRLSESFGRFATDSGMEVLGPPLAR